MNGPQTIGFDVYGTLVDPLAIGSVLRPYAGDQASNEAEIRALSQRRHTPNIEPHLLPVTRFPPPTKAPLET